MYRIIYSTFVSPDQFYPLVQRGCLWAESIASSLVLITTVVYIADGNPKKVAF